MPRASFERSTMGQGILPCTRCIAQCRLCTLHLARSAHYPPPPAPGRPSLGPMSIGRRILFRLYSNSGGGCHLVTVSPPPLPGVRRAPGGGIAKGGGGTLGTRPTTHCTLGTPGAAYCALCLCTLHSTHFTLHNAPLAPRAQHTPHPAHWIQSGGFLFLHVLRVGDTVTDRLDIP